MDVWSTVKKAKKIFLIHKEIQKGSSVKSYMTNGLPYMTKYLHISSYVRNHFLIHDFVPDLF